MNGNNPHEVNGQVAETLNLDEESASVSDGMSSYVKNLFKALRTNFSQKC